MKKLIITVIILFGIFTIAMQAQQSSVFGWTTPSDPPFPTNDTATLVASNEVFTAIPVIPGYTNQNSLQINIKNNGTGYMFLTCKLPQPITMPQYCNFLFKSDNSSVQIKPLIKYENEWYLPLYFSKDNFSNNWYRITDQEWRNVNNNNVLPIDSMVIDTCILYIANYGLTDVTLILDTWYNSNNGNTPILYCGFGDILSGLENISNQTPIHYNLLQNYPNPFNPSTKIQFTIPITGYANLTIYNMLGQLVTTLVNQELAFGTYEYDFNAANLPSGYYFYTLTTSDYKVTKKMVLLK